MIVIEIAKCNCYRNNKKQEATNGEPKFFHGNKFFRSAKIEMKSRNGNIENG